MTLRNYIQVSQRKGEKKYLLGMWVFLLKFWYHNIYFKKVILILKIIFHLMMSTGVFLRYIMILKLQEMPVSTICLK